MTETVVFSIFKYKGFRNKWSAFTRMGLPPLQGKTIDGLSFWKAFGSGGGNGFSIQPDWSTYGLVTVFDSQLQAEHFIETHTVIQHYQNSSAQHAHVFMNTIKAHGKWSKKQPFKSTVSYNANLPIVVITRATIKPKLLHKFWKYVPSVSQSMDNAKGLIYSKGIGEWPIFMQATFSFWEKGEHMMAYAYKNKLHADMVTKTRELGWYSEELFSRFHPYKIQGNLIAMPKV